MLSEYTKMNEQPLFSLLSYEFKQHEFYCKAHLFKSIKLHFFKHMVTNPIFKSFH